MNFKKITFVLLVALTACYGVATAGDIQKLKVNGFMTSAYAVTNSEVAYDADRVDENGSFYAYSRYGLQFQYPVNPNVNLMMQLIARGSDTGEDFDVNTDWAIIDYRMTDAFSLRTGKIKSGSTLLSNTVEVGYAHPWIKPPQVIYSSNYDAMPGSQLAYNTDITDEMTMDIRLTMLRGSDNTPSGTYKTRQNGIGLILESDSLTISANHKAIEADVSGTVNVGGNSISYSYEDVKITGLDFGFIYDSDLLLLMAEYYNYDIGEIGSSAAHTIVSTWATVGVHIDKFTPHVTYMNSKNEVDGGDSYDYGNGIIYGLRTELGEGFCLKIEYHAISKPEAEAIGTGAQFSADPDKDVSMYAIALDVVF